MTDIRENLNWYALYTKSRAEKKVVEELKEKTPQDMYIQPFIPLVYKRQKNRKKLRPVPMIPSYVFIRTPLDHDIWRYVVNNRNVVNFVVSQKNIPCPIADHEIESLKIIMEKAENMEETIRLEAPRLQGKLVKITQGPFEGVVGRVTFVKENRKKIFVNIENIKTAISIEINAELIEKIENYE